MSENLRHLKKYFKELTKEKVLKLKVGTVFIVYNPLIDSTREEIASKNDIVHNKHCYDKLRFFIKEVE